MNPIAVELNAEIKQAGRPIYEILSDLGRRLYFPKGLLLQGAEAKEKARHINATIGIATEKKDIMVLDAVMGGIREIPADQALNYAPSFGLPDLRRQWQKALYAKNPSLQSKTISLPVVTCGITHAVSVMADMLVDPEDTVVLPDKFWGNYQLILGERKGARFDHYPMFNASNGFNVDGLRTCVEKVPAGGKVVVLLNFPHNPTGYSLSTAEADAVVRVLAAAAGAGVRVVAVCDDAYFGLFYADEVLPESLFARLSGVHPNLLAVKLDGATKEDYVWGLRVGFITYGGGPCDDLETACTVLEKKTGGAVRGSISNAPRLSQTLMLNAMQSGAYENEKKEKRAILAERAERVKAVSHDARYAETWSVYPFNSGYFMCLRLLTVEAEALRRHLLDKYGVGLIALGKSDLRIAFSCLEADQIAELFETIYKGVQEISA